MSTVVDAWKEAWELAPNALRGGLLASGLCSAAGVLLRWRKLVWAGFAVPEAATVGTAAALGAETLWPALGLAGAPPGWLLRGEVMVPLATALAVLWSVPIGRAARRGGERAAAACFLSPRP